MCILIWSKDGSETFYSLTVDAIYASVWFGVLVDLFTVNYLFWISMGLFVDFLVDPPSVTIRSALPRFFLFDFLFRLVKRICFISIFWISKSCQINCAETSDFCFRPCPMLNFRQKLQKKKSARLNLARPASVRKAGCILDIFPRCV